MSVYLVHVDGDCDWKDILNYLSFYAISKFSIN